MKKQNDIWRLTVRASWILLMTMIVLGGDSLAAEVDSESFRMPPQRAKSKRTAEELYGPYKDKSVKELWDIRDEFYKTERVSADTNKVNRYWQWRRAIENKDPTYRSKTPIEFYGQVVDQYGAAVEAATVDLSWGKGTNIVLLTPSDGRFSLTGVTGSRLSVLVSKKEYRTGSPPIKAFNYADWFDQYYHLPYPSNPVVFRLQKLENPEPMYVSSLSLRLDVTGTVAWADFSTGKKSDSGDIGFSVVRDDLPGNWYSGYTLTILTPEKGGMVVTNEEFMFHAPEEVYTNSIIIRENPGKADSVDFRNRQDRLLYVRTWDAKYAAVKVGVSQAQVPAAHADLVIYFNPSGSRNLELGADNRIDAKEAKRIRGETNGEPSK